VTKPRRPTKATGGYLPSPPCNLSGVRIDVPQPREHVYDFLDVMANHEPFTNHLLRDWEYSGPARGVGSKARVRTSVAGRTDVIDIEVVAAEHPAKIVERNVGARGRRHANGTYTLDVLPGGGTRIEFEYSWQRAPRSERLTAPLVRAFLRRANERAMTRLAEQLAG
jgi:polyketide cyclase/dehydrase/lipid transport protein